MARHAAHAIAGERTILEVWILHLGLINDLAIEVRGTAVIQIELAFAHHSVTPEASVHHFAGELLSFRLVLECL